MFAFNFKRAPSKTVSCIAISGIVLRERRFCSPQMAVRSFADQPDRLGTRARDADLAPALAPPGPASSAGCRQRRTLTTSDRSAKRRTPTRPILYRRSFQVVRYDGLAKPPPTVCAARCKTPRRVFFRRGFIFKETRPFEETTQVCAVLPPSLCTHTNTCHCAGL